MKNNIMLVLLAIAAAITPGFAQEVPTLDTRDKFHMGLKVGYNLSTVSGMGGDDFNANPKVGFAGGVFLSLPIGQFLDVHPEVLFSQRGFRGEGTVLGSPYTMVRTTSYIDFPLFLSLKPTKFLSLLVGPQFSYTLKQRDVFTNAGETIQHQEGFVNDNVRKNTLCLLTGFDINIDRSVLGVRFGSDLKQNNGDGTSTVPRYKNIWMQCTFGFRI